LEVTLITYPKRTHTCGELRASHIGQTVTLTGWVQTRRDLGGLIFVDLRDRYGKTQIVFASQFNEATYEAAKVLRSEFVISVTGVVASRPGGQENPGLPTGAIEVDVRELSILNKAETPPFTIEEDSQAGEDLRLKYRYLDLRRPDMQRNLLLRHRAYQVVRSYYDRNNFVEVETPILMKSTPEGARDFLVPSRFHPGKFYALPQSPQTYKQILMVAGFDRYVQIVKCFRDEDQRADRQLEFTQIDVEMSFVDEGDVIAMTEGCVVEMFQKLIGVDVKAPFRRMSYHQAMEHYGSDKPDLRFGLVFTNISEAVRSSPFRVFSDAVAGGGIVTAMVVPGQAGMSRSQIDGLTDFVKAQGASGLAWLKVQADKVDGSVAKVLGPEGTKQLADACGAKPGDLALILSGAWGKTLNTMGSLRLEVASRLQLIPEGKWEFLWVTDFPLLEYSEEDKRYVAVHHPFTSPKPEDVHLLESEPLEARARAYDLVLNGNEIAGGSIRIFDSSLQAKMFQLLGIGPEEAQRKFGFMLDAFKYGAPPHGGIAYGFDRLIMLMAGRKSIRDVIAFPKTSSGLSLMDDAPSIVDDRQLQELKIRVDND
jgi:aspartyl-tRNA synthetase